MRYLFDQSEAKEELTRFFADNKTDLHSFGSRVNQTFEAFVFAKTIKYYEDNDWQAEMVNPGKSRKLRLKFSTRGAPGNYSYCRARKGLDVIQIRHQLRVDIARTFRSQSKPANICCDVVVMRDTDIDHFSTSNSLPNDQLVTFGEVKHMSAFAELIASFVGLVHELTPDRLKRVRVRSHINGEHLSPFLYVSGLLYSTASGIHESIKKRKYDLDIYSHNHPIP